MYSNNSEVIIAWFIQAILCNTFKCSPYTHFMKDDMLLLLLEHLSNRCTLNYSSSEAT